MTCCRSRSSRRSRRCRSRCSATYPGASSKIVSQNVAAPIEQQINGVDNMLYMSSISSSTGNLTLTVLLLARHRSRRRAGAGAEPRQPRDAAAARAPSPQQGVSVQKKSSSIMMLIAVYAKDDRYSATYVANYANVYVLDALKRVPGAGQAQIMGVADQAMRIWLKPDRMASLRHHRRPTSQRDRAAEPAVRRRPDRPARRRGPGGADLPGRHAGPHAPSPREFENIILRASQDGSAIVRAERRRARRRSARKDYSSRQATTASRRRSSRSTSSPARTGSRSPKARARRRSRR